MTDRISASYKRSSNGTPTLYRRAIGQSRADVEKLARALYDSGSVQFGDFRLKLPETRPDAPLSPIYINLRLLRSYPGKMATAIDVYRSILEGLEFDLIADVPMAATPFVAILSYVRETPMITPRQPKTHGSGARIDGVFQPGQIAVVVDDLITKADSKLESINLLESQGLKIHDVVVLIDREQGGSEELAAAGYHLHAAAGLSDLLEIYRRAGIIDESTYARVIEYMALPH